MPDLGISVLFKGKNMIRLLGGLWVALRISLISVVISIPLGILLGIVMTWKNPVTKAVTRVYLEIVRIMPQMVLLFIVFFGTTRMFGWNLSAELASVIVFTFWGIFVRKRCWMRCGARRWTSLVMMIGVVEVLKVTQQIIEANRMAAPNAAFGLYGTVFVLYFLACWPISMLAGHLEKKWSN